MFSVSQSQIDKAGEVWAFAESFGGASEVLSGHLQKQGKRKALGMEQAVGWLPMATLDAFACELYFKTLYQLEVGKPIRGHKLKELFDALPTGTQKSIRHLYAEHLKRANTVGMSPLAKSRTTFDACLEHSNDAFVHVRYLYESPQIELFYWPALRLAVKETILAICPEWRQAKR